MPRRVDALESLSRGDWPWMVFDRDGHAKARGATRVSAINRHEHAEGWCHHRAFAVVRNLATGEAWFRLNGSWTKRNAEQAPPKKRAAL